MKKVNNPVLIKNLKIKNIELIKKLGSLDYGIVTLFYGKYTSLECLILEIQNIEMSNESDDQDSKVGKDIINTIIKEYLELIYEDSHVLERIGVVYDDIKSSMFILYEYSKNNFIFLNEYLSDKNYEQKLTCALEILEEIEYINNNSANPVQWIYHWNIIVPVNNSNKKKCRFQSKFIIIEPFFACIYHKLIKYNLIPCIRIDYKSKCPEFITNSNEKDFKIDSKSDVWNYGMLIYEIIIGEKIFNFLKLKNDEEIKSLYTVDLTNPMKNIFGSGTCNSMGDTYSNINHRNQINSIPIKDVKIKQFFIDGIFLINKNKRYSIDQLRFLLNQFIEFNHSSKHIKDTQIKINDNLKLIDYKIKHEVNLDHKFRDIVEQKEKIFSFKNEAEKIIHTNCAMLKDLIQTFETNQIQLLNKLSTKFEKKINIYHNNTQMIFNIINSKLNRLNKEAINYNTTVNHLEEKIDKLEDSSETIKSLEFTGDKIFKNSEELLSEAFDFESDSHFSFFKWDDQYINRAEYIKAVYNNLNSSILENITFVKYNCLLKNNQSDEYVLNDELILKYLDDNFFFLKKNLQNLTEFLEQLSSNIGLSDLDGLKDYLLNNMEKAKYHIYDHIFEELYSHFDNIIEYCIYELISLIKKEKIPTDNQNISIIDTHDILLNLENDVESKFIETIQNYLNLNKNSILSKLSLYMTQDILINSFSDVFEKHFEALANKNKMSGIDEKENNFKLDLNNLSLGMEGFKVICDIFNSCKSLNDDKNNISSYITDITSLSLRANNIGDEGAKDLNKLMKKLTQLKSLSLFSNNISHIGIKSMIEGIHSNRLLLKLSLHCNKIGVEGSLYLSQALSFNNNIITLDIGNNYIKDEGLKIICNEFLIKNSTLLTLSLNDNILTDKSIEYLCEIYKKNTNFRLKNLSLNSNDVSYKNLEEFLFQIKKCHFLQIIDLSANPIEDKGANHIAQFIRENYSIEEILISNCNITNRGAEIIFDSIIDTYSKCEENKKKNDNFNLNKVNLVDNFLDIESFKNLFKANKKLIEIVDFQSYNTNTNSNEVEAICNNESLRTFNKNDLITGVENVLTDSSIMTSVNFNFNNIPSI